MALERQFEFPFERAVKNILKPKPGDKFDFYVHEWGSFDGIVKVPEGLGIEKPNVATDGFHYRPEITIHKTNSELNRPAAQSRGRT